MTFEQKTDHPKTILAVKKKDEALKNWNPTQQNVSLTIKWSKLLLHWLVQNKICAIDEE